MPNRDRPEYRCSFCGKGGDSATLRKQGHRLVAGPAGVFVCNECVDRFSGKEGPPSESPQGPARCSFCGKNWSTVHRLIPNSAGNVAICDECVDLCNEILGEEKRNGKA